MTERDAEYLTGLTSLAAEGDFTKQKLYQLIQATRHHPHPSYYRESTASVHLVGGRCESRTAEYGFNRSPWSSGSW